MKLTLILAALLRLPRFSTANAAAEPPDVKGELDAIREEIDGLKADRDAAKAEADDLRKQLAAAKAVPAAPEGDPVLVAMAKGMGVDPKKAQQRFTLAGGGLTVEQAVKAERAQVDYETAKAAKAKTAAKKK